MNYTKMHIKNIIQGKIGKVINPFIIRGKKISQELDKYTFVRDLTPSYTSRKNRVGVYTNEHDKKVVIKRVYFGIETLDAIYSRNEAFILKTLSEVGIKEGIAPEFVEFFEGPNHLGFATRYFEGTNVEKINSKKRAEIAIEIYSKLKSLSLRLKERNFYHLPVRRPYYYLVSFFFNIMHVIGKNPSKIGYHLTLARMFYGNYLTVLSGNYTLGFVHRDLFPDNLLYSEKSGEVKITDWESALVSDSLYDLAQIAFLYFDDLGTDKVIELVQNNLDNTAEKKRFIALGIFNAMQILVHLNQAHPVFKQAHRFLAALQTEIAPKLIQKKSPFEIVNGFTLNLIYLFYQLTGLPKFSKKKRIILCYHSIGSSGWRFACPTADFANQLEYLRKYANMVSLPELLEYKQGGVAITFDDGYLDILKNAFPLLEKIDVKATMFALGDETHPNRFELDNQLPLMTIEQLQHLHKSGWEIGSHTATHSHLAKISDTQLEVEIKESKKMLEKKLGFDIKYFAYPKGIYSKKIVEFVKNARYEKAFTVDGYEASNKNDKPMLISRISIDGELSPKQFEALLSPLGIFVSSIYISILKFKESIHLLLDKR